MTGWACPLEILSLTCTCAVDRGHSAGVCIRIVSHQLAPCVLQTGQAVPARSYSTVHPDGFKTHAASHAWET